MFLNSLIAGFNKLGLTNRLDLPFCGILLLGMPLAPYGQYMQRPLNDVKITHVIENDFRTDPLMEASDINVETHNGIVTLSGATSEILTQERAKDLAESIKGVRAVVNRIAVKPVVRPDQDIAADIRAALTLNAATDPKKVKFTVQNGVVEISGTVDSYAERKLVEDAVKGIKGVRQAISRVTYQYDPSRSDKDIEADIREMLAINPYTRTSDLQIAVTDGKVKLRGRVGSAVEKSLVFSRAWVSGAALVDDHDVVVDPSLNEAARRETVPSFKDDSYVQNAVRDALRQDPRVADSDIRVQVKDDVVTLEGEVETLLAKHSAAQDAEDTIGVWKVANRLRVASVDLPQDFVIAKNVRRILQWDPLLSGYTFDINVDQNRVSIFGEVKTLREKRRAEQLAAGIYGVIGVNNNILVRQPVPTDKRLKEIVENKLFWNAKLEASRLTVDVKNGIIVVGGKVDTWQQYRAVRNILLSAAAKGFMNRIEVGEARQESPAEYYEEYYNRI